MEISADKRASSVHSVDRAISVLQVLSRHGTAGVTDIASELDVHKSTVFRLIATMEARGLVEQVANRGQYQLGHGIVQLAAGATRRQDIAIIGRSTCQELAEVVGETVNIVVQDGGEILSLDQVIGSGTVTTMNWAGQRSPLHATSAGKVFLAAMSQDERETFLNSPLRSYTDKTIVDRKVLQGQLDDIAKCGIGCTFEELELGLASVAAPIRNLDGDVVAAVAVSGPIFRINQDTLPEFADPLRAAALKISERNGFPKSG